MICIPARYASSRLPGKALLKIGGKTIIRRVYEQCKRSEAAEIVVATDDARIVSEVESFGGQACLSKKSVSTGSDRVAATLKELAVLPNTIVVNVQGDEPAMSPAVINQVAKAVVDQRDSVCTVCEPLESMQAADSSIVKVVRDSSNRALYFSRSSIPWYDIESRMTTLGSGLLRRHVGIYGYTAMVLENFIATEPASIELAERLEQLRFLYNGTSVFVFDAVEPCGVGVDTEEDYQKICELLESGEF